MAANALSNKRRHRALVQKARARKRDERQAKEVEVKHDEIDRQMDSQIERDK